jgi:hypothetical protein
MIRVCLVVLGSTASTRQPANSSLMSICGMLKVAATGSATIMKSKA